MKKLSLLASVAVALTLFSSCQKQQTEAERNAEIERQVQQRLAAEQQKTEQERLAQNQAELDRRLKDLENKGASTSTPVAAEAATMQTDAGPEREETTSRPRVEPDDSAAGSYDTFYTRLEPQGSWIETSNYGYVWQPRVAQESRAWRPYTDGRWVYTDAGWTWISEEPFGWATYHYGRWTRLRNVGWIWVPGDEWAPAWVSWRRGGDYVGWAPLPPEARFEHGSGIHNWADNYYDIGPDQYAFVSTNDFCNERVDRSIVPSDRNIIIVDQTTNVTNITYNNTIVINQGPNFEDIRSHSRRPVERFRLQRDAGANFGSNDPHAVVRGDVVEMPAPVITRARPVNRPRNVRQDLQQAEVDHGWENIADHQAVDRVRVKMKSEATPPPNAPSRTFVKPPVATAVTTTPPAPVATATPVVRATPVATATPAPVSSQPERRFSLPARPVLSPTINPSTPAPAATVAKPTAPPATATPTPAVSMTATPIRPTRTFLAPSPVPSVSTESTTSTQFGRGNVQQERKAERQQQRQEQNVAPASSAAAPTATSSTNAPPVNQTAPAATSTLPRKDQRRALRAGESAQSPSPSP